MWETFNYAMTINKCIYITVDNPVWFQEVKNACKQVDSGSRWAEIFTASLSESVKGVVFLPKVLNVIGPKITNLGVSMLGQYLWCPNYDDALCKMHVPLYFFADQ